MTNEPMPSPNSEDDREVLAMQSSESEAINDAEVLLADDDSQSEERTDEIQVSILEMKKIVQESGSATDTTTVISRLDQVQDRLITNLEQLNKRIENYIELLASQRKSA